MDEKWVRERPKMGESWAWNEPIYENTAKFYEKTRHRLVKQLTLFSCGQTHKYWKDNICICAEITNISYI